MGFAGAAYRLALYLYPAGFRRAFAEEMTLVFADRVRDARSTRARARLAVETVLDLARSLSAEHAAAWLGSASRRRRSATSALVLLAATLAGAVLICACALADASAIRPLPYPHAGRLVRFVTLLRDGTSLDLMPLPAYRAVVANAHELDAFGSFDMRTLPSATLHRSLRAAVTYDDALAALGAHAVLGKETLHPGEALLSEDLWRSAYGANPNVVGRSIVIGNARRRIAGVLAAAFGAPGEQAEIAVGGTTRDYYAVHGTPPVLGNVGRLRFGVSVEDADAALRARIRSLRAGDVHLVPYAASLSTAAISPTVTLALDAGALALMAFALLALRFSARSARAAFTWPAAALLAAIAVAAWAIGPLGRIAALAAPSLREPRFDVLVLAPAAIILASAVGCVRVAGRRSPSSRRRGVGALQFLLAVTLSAVAFQQHAAYEAIATGAQPAASDVRVAATVLLPSRSYAGAGRQRAFIARFREALRDEPSLRPAGLGTSAAGGNVAIRTEVRRPGARDAVAADYLAADPAFLALAGIDVRRAASRSEGRSVIVDTTLARHLYGTDDVVGKRISATSGNGGSSVITAVVAPFSLHPGDAQGRGLLIAPLDAEPWPFVTVLAESRGDLAASSMAIRRALARVDPALPAPAVVTTRTLVDAALVGQRIAAAAWVAGAVLAWCLTGATVLVARPRRRLGRAAAVA